MPLIVRFLQLAEPPLIARHVPTVIQQKIVEGLVAWRAVNDVPGCHKALAFELSGDDRLPETLLLLPLNLSRLVTTLLQAQPLDRSVGHQCMAPLELLTAAAGARLVSADLLPQGASDRIMDYLDAPRSGRTPTEPSCFLGAPGAKLTLPSAPEAPPMTRIRALLLAAMLAFVPESALARGHSSTAHSTGSHRTHADRRHSSRLRDPEQRRAFQRSHPCPSTGRKSGACPGYVVDHIKPLKRSGPDRPSNMQWQTKAEAKAKDAVE